MYVCVCVVVAMCVQLVEMKDCCTVDRQRIKDCCTVKRWLFFGRYDFKSLQYIGKVTLFLKQQSNGTSDKGHSE